MPPSPPGSPEPGPPWPILDTGVDVDHPFLGGRVVAQFCSSHPHGAGEQSLCPNGRTTDDSADVDSLPACSSATEGTLCDHGTHVAGIAAGNGSAVPGPHPRAGVAPGASIIAMQIFTRFNDPAFCGASACVASYPSDQLAALDELAAARHRPSVVEHRRGQPQPRR